MTASEAAIAAAWPAAWPPPPLMAGEVHVWRVRLDLDAEPPMSWLDDAERARAAAFAFPADRRRWVGARRALRALLAAYEERDPEALAITVAPGGKPRLAGGPPFSMSHAGPWALVAFSAGLPVGVDVEPARDLPDLAALAARVLGPTERAAWEALAADARREAFYRAWTRKEALLKAHGSGLAIEPALAEVGVGPAGVRVVALDGRRWAIADLALAPDVAAAVAVRDDALVVCPWTLPRAVCADC